MTSNSVADGVTMVRAESDVGFPKGPMSSATVILLPTLTSSFRMPAYFSPSAPSRIVTGPETIAES